MIGLWTQVEEKLPPPEKYVLFAFVNYNIPAIGRYKVDKNGDGTYMLGDTDISFGALDMYVNKWTELPEYYKCKRNEIRQKIIKDFMKKAET